MTLTSGTRLGPYEIQSAIGAGGMGEVYKAHDTRLDRSVAIKVLPPEFSADPDRRARFEREAKTIAGLNHPHICTLHDVGQHDNSTYLVMEHLQGQTLADRLAKGPLPLEQALTVATEIADALSAAHRQGVIHRDLKPGNVMLTKTGAKLLDFGLAKVKPLAAPSPASITMSVPTQDSATRAGTILGTIPYMAPEQLEGRDADARSDIFAFGALVYEMLTAKRAFDGVSQASLIAAILTTEPPPLSALLPVAPPALDRIVRRCLAKDPDKRWQSTADLTEQLRWTLEPGAGATATGARTRGKTRGVAALFGSVGMVFGLAAAGFLAYLVWPPPAPRPLPAHLSIGVAEHGLTLTTGGMAISPDGRTVVFAARKGGDNPQLYLRPITEDRVEALKGTENGTTPFFSPDGSWLAFVADGVLKKVRLGDDVPQNICTVGPQLTTRGHWGTDNVITMSQWPGVPIRVSADDRARRSGPTPPDGPRYMWPEMLPDGRSLLLTVMQSGDARIGVLRPNGLTKLPMPATCARYLSSGHLVYEDDGHLMAVGFDPERLEMLGTPRLVVSDIAVGATTATWFYDYDVSMTGTIVYAPGSMLETRFVWRDRTGRAIQLPLNPRRYSFPSLSRDGTQITVSSEEGAAGVVWAGSVAGEPLPPVGSGWSSVFSRDGKSVFYWKMGDLFRRPTDLSANGERIVNGPGNWKLTDFTPDGMLLFNEARNVKDQPGAQDRRMMKVRAEPAGSPEPLVSTSDEAIEAASSPDGKWIAYQARDTKRRWQIWVTGYPGPSAQRQVSLDGGMGPVWNPKPTRDDELFYQTQTALMSVRIKNGVPLGTPEQLFECPKGEEYRREISVAPDGNHFLFLEPTKPRTEIRIITSWYEELKEKVPVKR